MKLLVSMGTKVENIYMIDRKGRDPPVATT